MSKIIGWIKVAWNFYSILKAMRKDALRYRHLRSKKRKPELFDMATDAAMARERLI